MQALIQKKTTFLLLFIVASLLTSTSAAQRYTWPTNASHRLTSSFGEFRWGHFHAGIDIKTWGKEGYKVFATRNGYIWKVRISPFGYGKVIYQVLDTGEIAVYAHLQRFFPKLDRLMREEQKRRQSYSVTRVFRPGALRVRQGQVIAYTGRTGIGYPHLHFELRKNENIPINPLEKNFPVKDTRPPFASKLAVIPFQLGSQVDGWPIPQTYPLEATGENVFQVKTPIQIWGTVGLAIDAHDRADGVSNTFSLYKITLYLDGIALFHSSYRGFSYDKTDQIFLDRNFWLLANTGEKFFNLFVERGNTLPFYTPFVPGNGVIRTIDSSWRKGDKSGLFAGLSSDNFPLESITPAGSRLPKEDQFYFPVTRGPHQARIVLEDYFGNRSTVLIPLSVQKRSKPRPQWVTSAQVEANPFLLPKGAHWFQRSRYSGWLPIPEPDFSVTVNPRSGGWHATFTSPGAEDYDRSVYRIENPSHDEYPRFLSTASLPIDLPEITLVPYVWDSYTVFLLQSGLPLTRPIVARATNRKIGVHTLDLITHNLNQFTASLPSADIADDSTRLFVAMLIDSGDTLPLFQSTFYYRRVSRKKKTIFRSKNGFIELEIPPEASNRDFYVTIHRENRGSFAIPIPGDSLAPLYRLDPVDVPLFKPIQFSIQFDPSQKGIKQIAIYTPEEKKKRWSFVANSYDEDRQRMVARVHSLGYFTLIRDDQPPAIEFLWPKPGASIGSRRPIIRIHYQDDLADITGEENFRLTLDGNFCIAELDPELEIIRFQPEKPLSAGRHHLKCWIVDRAGNQSQKSISFFVRENR